MAPQPKQPGSKVLLAALQSAAAFVAGGCFGYGLGSLLLGDTSTAVIYIALGIGLYLTAILPAPQECSADDHA